MEDIRKIYLCDQGYRARVYVAEEIRERLQTANVLVPTCCTDNASLEVQEEQLREEPFSDISWKEEWVFALADIFAQDTRLHKSTAGTHSCMLAKEGQVLVSWEDIGRHNAMDKAIGWGMKAGVDLAGCMLYTSGRMPVDMVRKAIRAGIPVLAGKAVPTFQSVELAQRYGLTLIGGARPDRMKVYSRGYSV
jgi:FdhD protein